jgi:hypothetical protein
VTIEQALRLVEGSYVWNPETGRKHRVRELWQSPDRTDVRIQAIGFQHAAWVSALGLHFGPIVADALPIKPLL